MVLAPPQVPFAPSGPQPVQKLAMSSTLEVQVSVPPHAPGTVLQPAAAEHAAAQHSFVGPTPQVVSMGTQVHDRHVPESSQVRRHSAG
jgi:hypothetical protein